MVVKRKKKSRTNVFRRVAVWRNTVASSMDEIGLKKIRQYVSLDGTISSERDGYVASRKDILYLKLFNVSQSGKQSGLNHCYRKLKPYLQNWSSNSNDFSHWYLPSSIIRCYNLLGIHELYTWQAECLTKSLGDQSPDEWALRVDSSQSLSQDRMAEMRSILYAAPTSGGKSLVAEILMIRAALFCGKASLLILPHVSLCDERVNYLRVVLGQHSVGLKIMAFHSNDCSVAEWNSCVDIAVCTIEKANALINRLLMEFVHETALKQSPCLALVSNDSAITNIGLIVVDELHLMGDSQRGFLLELLLTKLRRLSSLIKHKAFESQRGEPISIRFVGLSATLPNLSEVGAWLGAEVYSTSMRPLPLYMYYKVDNKVMNDGGVKFSRELPSPEQYCNKESVSNVYKDPDHLGFLVAESILRREQCLVFCATKEWCQKACVFLTRVLPQYVGNQDTAQEDPDYHSLVDALTVLAPSRSSICPIILNGLKQKVAYHHAGMISGERLLIESAFRRGQLLVLCATSTLAVGVNLPVARVIFRSTQIGRDLLDAARFRQMAGRAGRKALDVRGEAIVLCSNSFDASRTARLLSAPIEIVHSAVVGLRLSRLILELVVLRLARTTRDILKAILQETFLAFQGLVRNENVTDDLQDKGDLARNVKESLLFLFANSAINCYESDQAIQTNVQPLDAITVLFPFFNTSSNYMDKIKRNFPAPYKSWVHLVCGPNENNCLPVASLNLHTIVRDHIMKDPLSLLNEDFAVEATPLGIGIVESASPIPEGTLMFAELYRARTQESTKTAFPLDTFVRNLDSRAQAVANFYGITESSSHQIKHLNWSKKSSIEGLNELWISNRLTPRKLSEFYRTLSHKRFYYALILYDLIHEAPISAVCKRFNLSYGSFMALKQYGVLQAGKVSAFCEKLQWQDLCALFRSLGDKLNSAYKAPESEELREIDFVQERQAKALLNANIRTLHDAATASVTQLCRAFEELGRSEIPSGKNCEFLLRQTRRRMFLAVRIRQCARDLLHKRLL